MFHIFADTLMIASRMDPFVQTRKPRKFREILPSSMLPLSRREQH